MSVRDKDVQNSLAYAQFDRPILNPCQSLCHEENFPHGGAYKVSPLLSYIPLDSYNRSRVPVPCDNHVVDCEKDDDGAKDYNRPKAEAHN